MSYIAIGKCNFITIIFPCFRCDQHQFCSSCFYRWHKVSSPNFLCFIIQWGVIATFRMYWNSEKKRILSYLNPRGPHRDERFGTHLGVFLPNNPQFSITIIEKNSIHQAKGNYGIRDLQQKCLVVIVHRIISIPISFLETGRYRLL